MVSAHRAGLLARGSSSSCPSRPIGPWFPQPLSPLTAAGPRGFLTRFPFHLFLKETPVCSSIFQVYRNRMEVTPPDPLHLILLPRVGRGCGRSGYGTPRKLLALGKPGWGAPLPTYGLAGGLCHNGGAGTGRPCGTPSLALKVDYGETLSVEHFGNLGGIPSCAEANRTAEDS